MLLVIAGRMVARCMEVPQFLQGLRISDHRVMRGRSSAILGDAYLTGLGSASF